MTLSDLGPGFHLVPLSDHVRISRARWHVRLWQAYAWHDYGHARPLKRRLPECYLGSHSFHDYESAKAYADRMSGPGWRLLVSIRRPMRRRAGERLPPAAHCLKFCDPMAIQAKRVLLGVLEDLRA